MLRSSLLLTLTLVTIISVCAAIEETADSETNLIRDKRQISIGFQQVQPLGEFIFTINGQSVRLTGSGSEFIAVPVNETLRYQNGLVQFFDRNTGTPTTPPIPVEQLSVFTDFNGFEFQTFIGGAPGDISLPDNVNGFFYYDRDGRAFYTNTDVIERQRPFPPLFPPPPSNSEVRFAIRGARPDDRLVLNIDNTEEIPDGVAEPEDDRITLTGSTATPVSGRQTFQYLADTIIVRDGGTVDGIFNGINELNVLDLVQTGGGIIQRLRTFSGGEGEFFGGGGTLYTNGGDAFYTTIPSVQAEISQQIVDSQFNFRTSTSPSSAIIESTLGQSGGNDLIELVGATTTTYPTASTISYNGGVITVNDGGGNLLQEIGTGGSPADLSTFFSNEVQQFSGGATGSINVPPGGLSLSFNSERGSAFAYPASNTILTSSIQNALEAANAPTVGTSFSIKPDGLGGANLIGQQDGQNEIEVVTVSNSQQYNVGEGDIIRYSGNTLTVQDRGGETATFPNIDLFSANSPPSTLQSFTGDATQTYSGPGRLYFDAQGRAFFTSNGNLINSINNAVSGLPGARPTIESRTVNGEQVGNIETPDGKRLVEVTSSSVQSVPDSSNVYYFNNEVGTANAFNIPGNARAFYDSSNERVTVTDTSGNELFRREVPGGFAAYRSPGGPIETITENITFPFNGVLYTGPGGGFYTINNDISEQIVNTIDGIGATIETISSINEFSFYNGQSIQIFNGSAPTSFPGGGTIFTSGGQSFYSTDQDFNDQAFEDVPKLAPISAQYNQSIDTFSIFNFGGDLIYNFSLNTAFYSNLGSRDSFTYDGDMIVGLTFEPLTGVDILLYYNGLELIPFTDGQNDTFVGPGFFVFNPDTGTAFFTDDPTSASIVYQRLRNVVNTFQRPVISQAASRTTSKFREVTARFGQTVTVYDGANVNLDCVTSSSNPAADFGFYVSTEGGANFSRIDETDMTDNFEITPIADGARLRINQIDMLMPPDAYVFRCVARNRAGMDTADTRVEIRPAEPPAIVNDYFPFTPVRTRFGNTSGQILRAQSPPASAEVIVSETQDAVALTPNPALVSELIHIGCKAEGRPKAEITWRQDGVVINSSLPQYDIFEPREGRSVLTVNFTSFFDQGLPVSGESFNFSCEASNGPLDNQNIVTGSITVTANEYTCTAAIRRPIGDPTVPCSVTCGFGVIPREVMCTMNGVTIPSTEVPNGLFEFPLELCQSSDMLFCPSESFAYNEDEEFGDCSVTCGTGVERRNISCFVTIDGVLTNDTVDELYCEDLNLRRPDDFRLCFRDDCPFWVITGTFGPCSSTCRGGVRMRQVDCYQNFTDFSSETNFTFGIVNDSLCEELTMPAREQECNRLIPCPFRWHASRWFDECENNCQERNITCINFEPSDPSEVWPVNDSFCAELRPPHSVRSCGYGVCDRGDWLAGPFSDCSVECGFGTYERAVYCTKRGTADTEVMEEGFCDVRFRPAEKERCLLRNCPGRCDYEPEECPLIARLRLCKEPSFRERAEPCCKSCPAQATPIPLLIRTPPTTEAATLAPTEPPITMGTMATP